MNLKTKGNSAWALLVPDICEYEFLPLYKSLGKSAMENLFFLNFKWQKEIFEFVAENVKKRTSFDLYIFAPPDLKHPASLSQAESNENHAAKKENSGNARETSKLYQKIPGKRANFKDLVKKEFAHLKINLVLRVPVQKKNAENALFSGFSWPLNSAAGKMKGIFEELTKRYDRVTVWNLESPCLSPGHFSSVFSLGEKSGILYTITSPHNRLILMSYGSKNSNDHLKPEIINVKIPAFHDLQSVQDIICDLGRQKSTSAETRTEELAAAFRTIRRSLP